MFEKGHPKWGGRPKGQGNKIAASIKELCQKAGPELVAELLRLAKHSRSEMVRIAAAKELLDRGFGKSKQTIEGEMLVGISAELAVLLQAHDGNSRSIPLKSADATDDNKSLPAPNGKDVH